MRKDGAVLEMFGNDVATRRPIAEFQCEVGGVIAAWRKIFEIPIVNAPGGNFGLAQALAANDFANNAGCGPPLAGAILQVTMPCFAARINSQDQRVWSAPFVQRVRVEKSEQKMARAGRHENFSGRVQR